MQVMTLSSKFQICIPKNLRKELGLKAGQKMVLIKKGHSVCLVPLKSLDSLRGVLRGANIKDYRDHSERI